MLPQPNNPNRKPIGPSRMVATPPKAPLLGQGPSARPPPAPPVRDTARSPEATNARFLMAQKMGTPSPENRPMAAPKPVAPMSPQQQAAQAMQAKAAPAMAPTPAALPRYAAPAPVAPSYSVATPQQQAAQAMAAKTGAGYPDPSWQPGPAYMMGAQPQPSAPTGGLVTPTSVAPVTPTYAASQSQVQPAGLANATPLRQPADVFVPTTPVGMNPYYDPGAPHTNLTPVNGNPRYDPTAPHAGAVDPTIGPDGQTIPERLAGDLPSNTTPIRTGEPSGPNPTDEFDWEALADELGIEGLQDQVKETTAKEALGAMTKPLSEYGFNPEELQAQEDQIIRAAAEAKAKAAQQMAGRGLGGSGLEAAGFGNIDVGAISAMTDLQTENKALQIEERLNNIKTYLSAYGSQLDDETRNNLAAEAMDLQRQQMEDAKGDQEESDRHTLLNNALAQVGADKWDPETLAWAYDQLDGGAKLQDILRALGVSSAGDVQTAYQMTGDAGGDGQHPNAVTIGQESYAEPMPWADAYDGGGAVSGTYEDSGPGAQDAYDSYVESAQATGLPPLSYSDWLSWSLTNAGNTEGAQKLTGKVWGQNYP